MNLQRLAMAAAVLLTACGLATSDDKEKKDKLDGTWLMESAERNGQQAPAELVNGFKLTFTGNKIKLEAEGREREGTIKIDATKKPKEIDITIDERSRKGIYELDGDKLKICHGRPGEDTRPTEFSAKEGTNQMMMILKRDKKDSDKPQQAEKQLSYGEASRQRPGESERAYFQRMDKQHREWRGNWKQLVADLKAKPEDVAKYKGRLVEVTGKPVAKKGKLEEGQIWRIRSEEGVECEVHHRKTTPFKIKGGSLPKELDVPSSAKPPEKPSKPVKKSDDTQPDRKPEPQGEDKDFDLTIYQSSTATGTVEKIDIKARVITIKEAIVVSVLRTD